MIFSKEKESVDSKKIDWRVTYLSKFPIIDLKHVQKFDMVLIIFKIRSKRYILTMLRARLFWAYYRQI